MGQWGDVLVAFLLGLVADRMKMLWDRRRRDQSRVEEAAAAIRDSLRPLMDLVRQRPEPHVNAERVADAWRAVAEVVLVHGHRLPRTAGHLRQSCCIALGHACGPVAFTHLAGYTDVADFSDYDRPAQDDAITYLEYVHRQLGHIADRPERADHVRLQTFDDWWRATGRAPHSGRVEQKGLVGLFRTLR